MKLKYVRGLACLLFTTAILSGCGSKVSLDTTSIYIDKDGTVKSAVYEEFDTSVYSEEELKLFIEGEVIAYNKQSVGQEAAYAKDSSSDLAAAIESLEMKGGDAVLKMDYASCADYLGFNDEDDSIKQLAAGTVKGAKDSGIDLDEFSLLSADGTERISGKNLDDDLYIVIAEGKTDIKVDGTIQYATDDVTVNKDLAAISSDGTLSCIVFK